MEAHVAPFGNSALYGFDAGTLQNHLHRTIRGLRGAMSLERIGGGQSNPTFFVTFDNRRLVLRKQPPGELLPSAHAVEREYRVTGALHAAGFPVVRPLALCLDDDVIGSAFYVMAMVEGPVHWCSIARIARCSARRST